MADRRHFAVAGVIAAVLALVLFVHGRWSSEPAATSGQPDLAPAAAEATPPDDPASGREPVRPRTETGKPLPPPGTPIAQIVDSLKTRADAGDSRAACRLAVELLRCQHLEQSKAFETADGLPLDVSMARRGALDAADRMAEMEIRKIQLGQQCQAVEPALIAKAAHYLASAARAGEPEAMLRYATGEHHGVLGELGFIRDPDFERWRRDAPGMLLRAAQAGRVDAANALATAYRTDGGPYSGLIPDDPLQGQAWRLLVSRLVGSSLPTLETNDAAIQAQATALAEQWHQRYFNNAVLVGGLAALSRWPLHMPMKPAEQEDFCE
jgi:hypothetical protein